MIFTMLEFDLLRSDLKVALLAIYYLSNIQGQSTDMDWTLHTDL